jgi:predicted dehydrogenase
LRVGIAGYGLAGRIFHGRLLRGAGFSVEAILTNNPTRIEQARADFPAVTIVPTIESLVTQKLDLIVIASANSVHASQAIAALRAGIPVVVDKPMGRTLAETEEIVAVSQECGVPVTVFFNRRWDSDTFTIKRVLSEGLLGQVHRMDSRFERFRPTLTPGSWREHSSVRDGGGLLLDLQTHLLSTALELFGSATLTYSSVKSVRGAADDDVVLGLQHSHGVDSFLSASAVVGSPGPRVRVLGSQGALVISDLDPQEALLRSGEIPTGGSWSMPTNSRAFLHRGDEVIEIESENGNYAQFYIQVKGALLGHHEWPVSISDALAVAQIIDEARISSVN